jgi:hypothetical protein
MGEPEKTPRKIAAFGMTPGALQASAANPREFDAREKVVKACGSCRAPDSHQPMAVSPTMSSAFQNPMVR